MIFATQEYWVYQEIKTLHTSKNTLYLSQAFVISHGILG